MKLLDATWYLPNQGVPPSTGAECMCCGGCSASQCPGTQSTCAIVPWSKFTHLPTVLLLMLGKDAAAEFKAERIPGAQFFDLDMVADRSTSEGPLQ